MGYLGFDHHSGYWTPKKLNFLLCAIVTESYCFLILSHSHPCDSKVVYIYRPLGKPKTQINMLANDTQQTERFSV